MGMCVTNLRKLTANGEAQDLDLTLSKNGVAGEKSMGELSVSLILTPRTAEEQHLVSSSLTLPLKSQLMLICIFFLNNEQLMTESVTSQAQKKMQKQTWNGMLNVLLIEVQDLPSRRSSVTVEAGNTAVATQIPGYFNVFAKLR